MPSIDFYAVTADIRGLIHAILEETDLRIFESYSRYDMELREFRSYDQLSSAFNLGTDEQGNGNAVLLIFGHRRSWPMLTFNGSQ